MFDSNFAKRYQIYLASMKRNIIETHYVAKPLALNYFFSSVWEKSSSVISFTIHKHVIEKKLKKLPMQQKCGKLSSHQAILDNKKNS